MILIDIKDYDIAIMRHAFKRALKRGIHPDMIEHIIINGKIKRFGKNRIKFINKGSKRTIICVGEIINNKIKIITVEVN